MRSIFLGQWFAQKPKRIKDDRSLMREERSFKNEKGTQAIKPDKLATRAARKTKGRRADEKYKNFLPWKGKGGWRWIHARKTTPGHSRPEGPRTRVRCLSTVVNYFTWKELSAVSPLEAISVPRAINLPPPSPPFRISFMDLSATPFHASSRVPHLPVTCKSLRVSNPADGPYLLCKRGSSPLLWATSIKRVKIRGRRVDLHSEMCSALHFVWSRLLLK